MPDSSVKLGGSKMTRAIFSLFLGGILFLAGLLVLLAIALPLLTAEDSRSAASIVVHFQPQGVLWYLSLACTCVAVTVGPIIICSSFLSLLHGRENRSGVATHETVNEESKSE